MEELRSELLIVVGISDDEAALVLVGRHVLDAVVHLLLRKSLHNDKHEYAQLCSFEKCAHHCRIEKLLLRWSALESMMM